MASTASGALPHITLGERDRRYALIREQLKARGVDGVVVSGSNLFYLTNGLPGERYGVLPTEKLPIRVLIHGRHLADLSADVLADAQDWVKNLRPGDDASPVVDVINELHLEKGAIGLGDSPRAIGHAFYTKLQSALPLAKLVDVSDVFVNMRTIKSDEEIEMIAQANRIFDAAIDAVHQGARPGMLGSQIQQLGIKAMWEAGSDVDSTFSVNFGSLPKQNPILAHLSLTRPIQRGDIATLTAHAEYGHYGGHSDQEISVGQPSRLHREMFDAVVYVREAVLKKVKPGATHRDLVDAYRTACAETGFRSSPHSQIHQYGIDVPEFPGPAFNVENLEAGAGGPSGMGGSRDFILAPGMIYSISPTVMAMDSDDTLLGGTTLVVTETGYRDLTDRKVSMLTIAGEK